MSSNIRIDGLYDLKTFEILSKEGIRNYSFDFRPKSFNFIQQYKFVEFLNSNLALETRFFLHFDKATDNAIPAFLEDFKKETSFNEGLFNQLILEFSDQNNIDLFDQFSLPFIWHWKIGSDISKILECKNLVGLVIDYDQILRMSKSNLNEDFYKKICGEVIPMIKRKGGEIFLSANWPQIIAPSLLEFMAIDYYSFPLNAQVELSYRVLNYPILREKIFDIQQLFNIA